ncbi:MAG: hypothetical protein HONBIEJF_02408 [Fimbriimonadaceae bacterium]|nr:hypothetical protein [Fimbriimonadaceae bacterium]
MMAACGGGGSGTATSGGGSNGGQTGGNVDEVQLKQAGGLASCWNGDLVFDIGPRSILADTVVKVTKDPSVATPSFGTIIRAYTFEPFPFSFIQFPGVRAKYDPSKVTNESKVSIYVMVGGSWAEAIQANTDVAANECTCLVAGLDPIAIIERR